MATVIPGSFIGLASDFVSCGLGTYVKDGVVFSALAGTVRYTRDGDNSTARSVEVTHWRKRTAAQSLAPRIGDIVYGRVTRITTNVVNVDIICLGETVLPLPCSATLRVEDVFSGEVDIQAIQIENCFRPGDVVKARIMSLGDTRHYYLSTADVTLGVVWTRDPNSGDFMLPVAWDEVGSPETGTTARRKTAQPINTNEGNEKTQSDSEQDAKKQRLET